MKQRNTPRLATALGLAALALLAAGAARAGGGTKEEGRTRLWLEQDGDRLEIDDLGDLAVGESRELATESGKRVTVTRETSGYTVDIEGRKVRLAALDEEGLAPGARLDRVERLELDGDGRTKVVVLAGDGELPRHPGHDGFGYFVGHGLPPLGGVDADALVAGLEKSERFQGLDDATQELVRSLVREAAAGLPKMRHVEVHRLVEDGAASAE